jgi:hypothetical protein
MPTFGPVFELGTFFRDVADFALSTAAENRDTAGTPMDVEHYVGRAGPDPGYVNLPPSTVGIGGPLISPKKPNHSATHDVLWIRRKAARP